MTEPRTNLEALGLVAGFGIWSLGFVLLYGAHGLACGLGVRPGEGDGITRAALILIYAAHIAAHLGLIRWFDRRRRKADPGPVRLIRTAALTLAVASLGATIWTGFPVLTLSICS